MKKLLFSCMLGTWALLIPKAYADHQHELTLQQVEVVSKQESASATQLDLNTARETINHTAGGVTIVDLHEVREGRVSNFRDTLGLAAGVLAQSRFGAEETRLSIRG